MKSVDYLFDICVDLLVSNEITLGMWVRIRDELFIEVDEVVNNIWDEIEEAIK